VTAAALPTFTRHATERWAYRCQGRDLIHEWLTARRINAKRLARLNGHSGNPARRTKGTAYYLSAGGVVFVVGRNGAVLTVYGTGLGP
jgi:hypothetical protein